LKVLTIIHNFDLSVMAPPLQRLFGKQFPDLFESVVLNMGVTQTWSIPNSS